MTPAGRGRSRPPARLASLHGPLRHPLRLLLPAATRAPSGTGAAPAAASGTRSSRSSAQPAPAPDGRPRSGQALRPVPLGRRGGAAVARLRTGIGELDRVLGGGLVPGSLVLLGGSPGIGKSTHHLRARSATSPAAGTESALRVRRGVGGAGASCAPSASAPDALRVPIVAETDLDSVVATLEAERPEACVIDSVQVLHDAALTGAPGSVGQVREVAGRLMRVAKERGIAVLLVGHVTKEGALAGPRVLEHLVDCVLSFEGERERTYRTLRALKNRFGSTNEVGVFEMRDERARGGRGRLRALRGRGHPRARARSCSARWRARARCSWRSRRSWLPTRARAAAAGGQRRRPQPAGARSWPCWPATRASRLGGSDVFVSIAGGVRVEEPGADLAIALARRLRRPRRGAGAAATSRWRPSASSGSPASCATPPTPTAAWPRPASSALETSCTPDPA